mmetsp:Transcript_22890/g.47768  ORF Transcript_22890/g.47768 Transcript_22890/m.47768 type:complete len:110 (+) Transcript_22890:558-887(+)
MRYYNGRGVMALRRDVVNHPPLPCQELPEKARRHGGDSYLASCLHLVSNENRQEPRIETTTFGQRQQHRGEPKGRPPKDGCTAIARQRNTPRHTKRRDERPPKPDDELP